MNYQIIRRCRVGSEDNYRPVGYCCWILASDDDEGSYLEGASVRMEERVEPLTHASRGDNQDGVFCIERKADASPDGDGAEDYDPY